MALKAFTVRLDEKVYDKAKYWAEKHGMSLSEYFEAAIELKVKWDNQDYDLMPMEIQRLNQLIDVVTILSENQKALESVIVSGFDSMLNLTRGDNYLEE